MVPISLSVVAYIFVGLVGAVLGAGLYEVFRRRSALARRAEAEDQSAPQRQEQFPSGGVARGGDIGPQDDSEDIPFVHLDEYGMDGQRELRQY